MRAAAVRSIFRTPSLGKASQITAFLLIFALVGAMAIQPTRQLLEQRKRIAQMKRDLGSVNEANESLEDLVTRLKDPDFIERRAREQIGLVHPGEIAYAVVPPGKKARKARAGRRHEKVRPAPPAPPGFLEGLLSFIGLS